ncbi:uncharacterized protein [Rutidosis leptorrhynchoides]|uniref:uncharacterized protein n=1 Tax=Rutidosis leptorrhynchoides TaxID=125765 RepID=UPI003A99F4EB
MTHQFQFRGTPKEDAFEHLRNFKSIYNLFKIAQVTDTFIYLRVFPWSLNDDAKDWLKSLPEDEIDSWPTMEDKFLQHFFLASKAAKLQSDINHFVQKSIETLYDAWTQFGGSLMKKTPDEANNFISETATHSYDWHQEMDFSRSSHVASTETSDELASVRAQLATVKRQMELMTKEMHAMKVGCELCQGPHLTKDCNQDYGSDKVIPTYTHNGEDGWIRVSDITPVYGNYLMSLMTWSSSSSDNQDFEVKSVETTEFPEFSVDEIEVEEEVKPSPKLEVYKTPIPYPRAIPSQQPKDTVYLMAKKGEHEQASSMFLEVECAAILEKSDMPPKLGDPGSFIVPCRIDDSEIFRCLTDSGASINLMPLSVYSRLGLNELKCTNTGFRLVNQSCSKPIGIAENLVVKIGELEFPANFVVVDMPEDKVVPIVLGRSFLATADSVNVITSVETEASKPNKCGGIVEEKLVVDTPKDSVIDKSKRKLYNRVRNLMFEKDEHVRNRLASNLSRKEKEKLRKLTKESKMADVWLLNASGYIDSIKGSGGLKDGTAYHPATYIAFDDSCVIDVRVDTDVLMLAISCK